MPRTITAEQSDQMSKSLGRLDKIAQHIQENHEQWGMPFEQARGIVNDLDKTADEVETFIFGPDSLRRRQTEILREAMAKEARVVQRNPDEPYMDTFRNPHQPVQTDADEAYMSAYNDDQSSAVETGKEENGEPLAP